MVDLRRLYISLLFSLVLLTAVAQTPVGGFIERQLSQLALRGERITAELDTARQLYLTTPTDSLAMAIHELEKQSLAIEGAIARLSEQQKAVVEKARSDEQEIVAGDAQPEQPIEVPAEPQEVVTPAPEQAKEQVAVAEDSTEEPDVIIPQEEVTPQEQHTEDKVVVSEELKSLFSTTTRRYALTEQEIDGLINDYGKAYKEIFEALDGYEKATSLSTLEKHYADYQGAVERSSKIADAIADRSDLLFTSKAKAYLMFTDTLGLDSLRADYIALAEQTEATMTEKLAGRCTDLDIAMYPHRLRGTLYLEAMLARHYAPESADSLLKRYEEFDTTHTLFTPWNTPKRSNATFKGVKINKKAKDKAVSSLPTLKIPSEGELYSITVGNYASLPPSTKVFRGATPLYRERREDGRTYIYIGLYPTAKSAQDDIALLRKAGFKQPELVMWRDGIRRDDFVDRSSATTSTSKAAMWRIEIGGISGGALPAEALAVIREKAPRKEISKFSNPDGTTLYTIGIFTKESEAKTLATAIGKASSEISIKVVPVGKK